MSKKCDTKKKMTKENNNNFKFRCLNILCSEIIKSNLNKI